MGENGGRNSEAVGSQGPRMKTGDERWCRNQQLGGAHRIQASSLPSITSHRHQAPLPPPSPVIVNCVLSTSKLLATSLCLKTNPAPVVFLQDLRQQKLPSGTGGGGGSSTIFVMSSCSWRYRTSQCLLREDCHKILPYSSTPQLKKSCWRLKDAMERCVPNKGQSSADEKQPSLT